MWHNYHMSCINTTALSRHQQLSTNGQPCILLPLELLYFQDPLGEEGVSLTVNPKLYWRHVRLGTRYSALGL